MRITFGRAADAIIERLGKIDHSSDVIDRARVENALARHLEALNLAPTPIRWVLDAQDGYSAADWYTNADWYAVANRAARIAGLRPLWGCDWYDTYDAARSAANNAANKAAENVFQKAKWNSPNSASWSAVEAAALRANVAVVGTAAYDRYINVLTPLVDAVEAGLWLFWVRDTEIIAVPRPSLNIVDNRLHNETGPAISWPGGEKYWFWKGTQVSQQIIEAPETLTPAQIDEEVNVEIRRIMIERFGTERYIREGDAVLIATHPVHGDLYRMRREDDSPIVMLHVKNNTVEPDGTVREFWIRIHPECRPFRARDKWVGDMQRMTPLNARASTWGLTGEVFKNLYEAT